MTKDITLYTIIICIRGFGIGLSTALFPLSTIDVMGVEMLPAMFGVSQLLQGFVEIMIGTLTGAVQDKSMDFTYTCWILGGCPLVGFCLWLLMPCAERFDRKFYKIKR
ncbi:hypothetical protein Avbf_10744 [Armadillidium vulgare]|nr:hypothetical protein Avbf_10744 [Armadillidium vulgare]